MIIVKTPITSNGRDVILDASGKIRYKETILEDAARNIIEKKNAKLPQALQKIILPYNPDSSDVENAGDLKEAPAKTPKNVKAK